MENYLNAPYQPKVLLASFATNWDSVSEIPYLLKQAGCVTDVFCHKNSWLKSNSYFNIWISCEADESTFPAALSTFVTEKSVDYDWIILGDDPLVNLMNDYLLDETIAAKILPITKLENRMILGSKIGLSKFCSINNILTPAYHIYTGNNFTLKTFYDKEGFPLLTKEDRGCGGGGVKICNNVIELMASLAAIPNDSPVLIQKYLGNKAIGVEALFKNGKLLMHNCSVTLLNMTTEFSITTKRNFISNNIIAEALRNFGDVAGLNGFVNGTYIYHEASNTYSLIEIDTRPNSWMAYGKFIGNDFSLAVKHFFNLSKTPIQTEIIDTKREIVLFNKDIKRCILNNDFIGLLKWVFNYKGYWAYIPLYDKILFTRIRLTVVKLTTKKIKARIIPILKIIAPNRYAKPIKEIQPIFTFNNEQFA
ncbi:MAG: hypothetical protein H7068_07770 [Pedobacter sp.]|nr:hypothetical protein [Chitinophagaceae bacterium]